MNIVTKIRETLDCYEALGLKIASIWLNSSQVRELYHYLEVFDASVSSMLIQHLAEQGKFLVGVIFGVRVFSSNVIPVEHIAVLPEGFEGRLISHEAATPFLKRG